MSKQRTKRRNPTAVLHSLHTLRCQNLLSLVGEGKRFQSQSELATALGLSDGSYISQIVGPTPRRRFTEVVARRFEYTLKLEDGWLDLKR